MTTLYLIRHAEAEGNLYRRIHGQYDSLVTENGYRQIRALEKRFADVPVDAVYSSDLFRTMTTARSVCIPKNLPLFTRSDLREIYMGDWEDRSWAGRDVAEHEEMVRFSSCSPDFRAPGGGETYRDIRRRGTAAVLDIAAAHPGQTVCVFAHGTIIRHILAEFQGIGLGPEEMKKTRHSDNTAVTKLEIEDGRVRIVYSDDNSHLEEDISTLSQQHWWKKDGKNVDVNLWFLPMDLSKAAEREYFAACREEAWRNLYGTLDRYDGRGFLADAMTVSRMDPACVITAMQGRRRAGVLQLDPTRDAGRNAGYISFLYLAPDQRRRGIGVQLIGKAVSVFRPRGRDKLRLVCSEANAAAMAFYEKYGFTRIGEDRGAYGKLYQMEKYIGYEYRGELD